MSTPTLTSFVASLETILIHKHHKAGQYNDHMSRLIPKVEKAKTKKGFIPARISDDRLVCELLKKKGLEAVVYEKVYRVLRSPKDRRTVIVAHQGTAKVPVWILGFRFHDEKDCLHFQELIRMRQHPPITEDR